MAILQMAVRLESTICAACGVEFAMPSHLLSERRRNAGSVTCPSGHASTWKETEADRLRKQLAEKERDLAFQKSQREAETRRAEEATARALKAEAKVKRAEAGVCTLCNRTVSQMARHMATKHPKHGHSPKPHTKRKASP